MWKVNNVGLQDWKLFDAAMKPVNMRKLGIACAISVLCVLVGCTSQQMAQTHSGKANHSNNDSGWRGIEPTRIAKLVIAANDGHAHTFTNLATISESAFVAFVQSIYRDLVSRESLEIKRYLMVAPKLLVFADEENNLLCAFLYWPAGKPEHVFTPCKAERSGDAYQVEWPASRTLSVSLPGFDERVRAYLDVWK